MSDKIKDTFTQDELLAEILKEDPDFKPFPIGNIVGIREVDIEEIKIISFEEMIKENPPPIEYVMTPIIPEQGIIFVYAATGVGKTLFTLNLAYAIAGGGDFLKYSCKKPRRVLYVDGEMAYNQIHARIMMIQKQQGDLDYKENFLLLTPDKCPIRIPQLDDPIGQDIYLKLLEKYQIEVIVFDNISTLTNFDENKSHEWKPVQDFMVKLRSQGKTIINVHHSGKDKFGYRGTSRMLDVADLAISLQPQNEDQVDDNPQLKKFKIVYQKPRHLIGIDALPFEVIFEGGRWSYQSVEISTIDKIIECVNANMSQREIAKELLMSQPYVNKMIKKLRLQGRLSG